MYSRLKSSIQCKIIESSSRFVFCRNLKKRSKNQHKSIKAEQKCNVTTSAEECRDITLRVTTTAEECRYVMAMLRHRMKETEHRNSESQHQLSNVATLVEGIITEEEELQHQSNVVTSNFRVPTSAKQWRDIRIRLQH